jgi:hypothetical protein
MKQGLKIILFVLPQLFALFLKSNTVFSAPYLDHKHTSFSHLSDFHFSNVEIADGFQEYEIEYEDDEFSDYYFSLSTKEVFTQEKVKSSFNQRSTQYYHIRLYILYSSLKLHCPIF